MCHTRANIERPYTERENSRRGLNQLEFTFKTTTIGLKKYLVQQSVYYTY